MPTNCDVKAAVAVRLGEAAARMSLSEDTFNQYVRPHLRVVRVGRVTLYPVTELEKWVHANAEASIVEQLR